jgi:hypothetical protein
VIAVFLSYAAAAAMFLPVAASVRTRVILLNFAVLLAYGALIHFGLCSRFCG